MWYTLTCQEIFCGSAQLVALSLQPATSILRIMSETDPLTGVGKALARLRRQAGFSTQTEAAEALQIDKGQLSRWENENPRPSLENLGRALAGYGATMADLSQAMGSTVSQRHAEAAAAQEEAEARKTLESWRGPTDEELIRSLTEALRHIEGRQEETESRLQQIERDMSRNAR